MTRSLESIPANGHTGRPQSAEGGQQGLVLGDLGSLRAERAEFLGVAQATKRQLLAPRLELLLGPGTEGLARTDFEEDAPWLVDQAFDARCKTGRGAQVPSPVGGVDGLLRIEPVPGDSRDDGNSG